MATTEVNSAFSKYDNSKQNPTCDILLCAITRNTKSKVPWQSLHVCMHVEMISSGNVGAGTVKLSATNFLRICKVQIDNIHSPAIRLQAQFQLESTAPEGLMAMPRW